MIKRYNQFVKENVSEDFDLEDAMASTESEIDTMVDEPKQIFGEEPSTDIPVEEEEEEVEEDPYEKALEDLALEAGVEYEKKSKSVMIGDKEVTFPSEKNSYKISGIKGDFNTPTEVIEAINKKSSVKSTKEVEPSFEETEGDLARRDLESEMGKFESKSYKNSRMRRTK